MEAEIIKDSCIGCGACEAICPDVFEIGEEGIAKIKKEINDEDKELVKEARDMCPTEAIKIKEAN